MASSPVRSVTQVAAARPARPLPLRGELPRAGRTAWPRGPGRRGAVAGSRRGARSSIVRRGGSYPGSSARGSASPRRSARGVATERRDRRAGAGRRPGLKSRWSSVHASGCSSTRRERGARFDLPGMNSTALSVVSSSTGLHPLAAQGAGVGDLAVGEGVQHAARGEALHVGIVLVLGPERPFGFLLGIQVVQIAEELVEAVIPAEWPRRHERRRHGPSPAEASTSNEAPEHRQTRTHWAMRCCRPGDSAGPTLVAVSETDPAGRALAHAVRRAEGWRPDQSGSLRTVPQRMARGSVNARGRAGSGRPSSGSGGDCSGRETRREGPGQT